MISPEHEGNSAMFLAGWPHGNFNVLAEGGQKVHEPLHREVAGLPTHQTGNMRLPDAQNRAGLCLCEFPFLDQPVDLEREAGLEQLPFGVGKAEVGKNVAATLFDPDCAVLLHLSCASLCSSVLPRRATEPASTRPPIQVYVFMDASSRAADKS